MEPLSNGNSFRSGGEPGWNTEPLLLYPLVMRDREFPPVT